MKRRRILMLLALATVVAGLFLFWPRGPKEPVYQGKMLSQWIKEAHFQPGLGESLYFNSNETARLAVRTISTNALPWLMSEFERKSPRWIERWKQWAYQRSMLQGHYQAEQKRLDIADAGLRLLGPDAAPALPALAGHLGDEGDRGLMAASIMATVGEEASPWLLKGVASTNPVAAQNAMHGLVALARQSEPAIVQLVHLLNHPNTAIRRLAAWDVRRVVSRPDLTLPPLVTALADPDFEVRSRASHSLGELGLVALPVLPELRRLMTSTNEDVAGAASNAVFGIDIKLRSVRGGNGDSR